MAGMCVWGGTAGCVEPKKDCLSVYCVPDGGKPLVCLIVVYQSVNLQALTEYLAHAEPLVSAAGNE